MQIDQVGISGCKTQTLTMAKSSKKEIHWNNMGKVTEFKGKLKNFRGPNPR